MTTEAKTTKNEKTTISLDDLVKGYHDNEAKIRESNEKISNKMKTMGLI
jgi:hypothetical protein